jgi:hypothetical protein
MKMLDKLLRIKPLWALVVFAFLDIICIGMGMGVPIFCILFGFPVGWIITRYITTMKTSTPQALYMVLKYAILTAGFTMLAMAVLWGPTISLLFDPARDLANFGIPMILYEPRASFIGWIVLMIVISPFLQLLTTLFGAYLALLGWTKKAVNDQKVI